MIPERFSQRINIIAFCRAERNRLSVWDGMPDDAGSVLAQLSLDI